MGFLKPRPKLTFGWVQGCHSYLDSATPKLKIKDAACKKSRFFGLSYATDRVTRNETLIEKDIWRFLSIVFDLERTNQLNPLPDKDLVDLCHPIEPYQVTKNRKVMTQEDIKVIIHQRTARNSAR